jgi:ectoine hydroxylase-related dioxygenase (phytanoyl-CoA dioxygenase family)
MMRHERVLDIVAQLIGPQIRQNGHKLNMKYAEYGSPVEWHQDFAFYPHTNDDLLAVGIAIDDMTLENGCLLVIPGSHKGPMYDHHQDGIFVGAVTDPDFTPTHVVPIQLKAGGISIHHARALHASAPNTSPYPRRFLLYQYCAIDAWPLLGVSGWDSFNSCILRGEPTYEPRLAPIPVRIPLPSGSRTGSIYEIQTQFERSMFK